jgi:hypothetical protein
LSLFKITILNKKHKMGRREERGRKEKKKRSREYIEAPITTLPVP